MLQIDAKLILNYLFLMCNVFIIRTFWSRCFLDSEKLNSLTVFQVIKLNNVKKCIMKFVQSTVIIWS